MKKKRTQSKGVLSYKKKRTKSKNKVSSHQKKRTKSKQKVSSYQKKRTKSKKRVSSHQKKRTVSKPRRKRTLRKSKGGAQSDDEDFAEFVQQYQQSQPQAQVEPEVVQSEDDDDDNFYDVRGVEPEEEPLENIYDDGEELDIGDIRIGLDDDDEEERGEEEEEEVPRRGQYVDEEARNKATAKRGWSKVRSKIPSIVEEEEEEVPRRGQYVDEEARNKATAKRGWSKVLSSVEQAEAALAEAKILEEQERKTDEFVESLGAELPNRPYVPPVPDLPNIPYVDDYVDPGQESDERIKDNEDRKKRELAKKRWKGAIGSHVGAIGIEKERGRGKERARERHQQSLRERDERIKDKEDRKKRDLAKKRWKGAIGSHVEAIGIEKERGRERERELDLDRIEEQERKTDDFVESLGAELPSSEYVPPVPDLPNIPYVDDSPEKKSTWSKFKSRFQEEEYEAFINRTGTELKELYLEYLTEYFKDIEEAEELDVLKGKYMSFIEKYYEIAIKNDKKLIDMLK